MDGQRKRAAGRRGLFLAAWLLAPLPVLMLGCEPAVRAPLEITAGSDTPDGQLKNVMRRLRFALKNAKPGADSGVVSRREASSRLIPPEGDSSTYTAEVTIKTSTELAPAEVARLKQTSAENADVANVDLEKIADAADISDLKVYNLIYKDKRWELARPPREKLTETEQLCFQYALSDG